MTPNRKPLWALAGLVLLMAVVVVRQANANKQIVKLMNKLNRECSQDSSEANLLLEVNLIREAYEKFLEVFKDKQAIEEIISGSLNLFQSDLKSAGRNKAQEMHVVDTHSRRVCGMLTILMQALPA